MLWMITKDLTNANFGFSRVGACNDDLSESLDSTLVPAPQRADIIELCETEFRLLDNDDEVYYEGVCKGLDDADQDDAFDPLDRYMHVDGVTTMQYRKKGDTTWSVL